MHSATLARHTVCDLISCCASLHVCFIEFDHATVHCAHPCVVLRTVLEFTITTYPTRLLSVEHTSTPEAVHMLTHVLLLLHTNYYSVLCTIMY